MVMTSYQISGAVGGQHVMFSNYAGHAQQISNMYGTGPQMQVSQMQNPFPQSEPSAGMAGAMVGGVGMALPGLAGAASIAGGLMGGPAGILDPWTMGARAFGYGSGAARGAGVLGTIGHIGGAFAQRGLMGGLGALGGGIGAAAMTALPYAAVGMGIQTIGESIYQGAQNVSQVGDIMGRQGPFYGQAGVRPGGQMSRGQIREITGILREFASEDVMLSMKEAINLTDVAQRSGMLSGVMNAQQFKTRFREIINQVRNISDVMGSTIEEAMPLFGQAQRMGLWRANDIMGMAGAMRAAGPAAPQLMGAMQAGATMAHRMGGPLGAGAMMGQEAFMNIQAAGQAGVLTSRDIREMTGGVGGAAGQQMVAQQLTGTAAQFAQSGMGRLMVAGLGEFEEGRFTGKIDPRAMQRFTAGQLDIGQLQARGRSRIGTRGGAASFAVQQGQIGQRMMAEGGMESVGQAVRSVMERAGYGEAGEDIQNLFIQKLMGVEAREADIWRRLGDEMPRIRDQRLRRQRQAIEDAARDLDRKKYRSFEGMKRALEHAWEQTLAPIEDVASTAVTRIGEDMDDLVNQFFGRTGGTVVTQGERMEIMRGGRGGMMGAAEMASMAQRIGGGTRGTPIGERFVRSYSSEGAGLFWGTARFTGGLAASALGMENADPYSRLGALGGFEAGGVSRRAQEPTLERLGYNISREEAQPKLNKLSLAMKKFMSNTTNARRLAKLREESRGNRGAYAAMLNEELMKDPEYAEAARSLMKAGGKSVFSAENQMDMLALAQKESGWDNSFLSANLQGWAQDAGLGALDLQDTAKVLEYKNTLADEAAEMLKEPPTVVGTAARTIASLSMAAFAPHVAWTAGQGIYEIVTGKAGVGEALTKAFTGAYGVTGAIDREMFDEDMVSSKDLLNALENSDWGHSLSQWIRDRADENSEGGKKFIEAVFKKNDPKARKIYNQIAALKARNPAALSKLASKTNLVDDIKRYQTTMEAQEERKTLAGKELAALTKRGAGPLSTRLTTKYRQLLEAYTEDPTGERTQDRAQALAAEISGDTEAMDALRRTGGAVAGHTVGMAMLEGLSSTSGMSAQQLKKRMREISRTLGYDVLRSSSSETQKMIKEAMEGGLTFTELRRIRGALGREVGARGPVATPGGREAQNEKLLGLLGSYAESHQKFVWAVGASVAAMQGKGEDITDKLKELQTEVTSMKSKGYGQN